MKETIQGLEEYSYDEVVKIINDFIIDRVWDSEHSADDIKLNDIRLHGSRLRNQARDNSDLDAVVEYDGDIREDDFFNILNDDPLYIDDVRVDINPIKEDLNLYMKRSKEYDTAMLNSKDKGDNMDRLANIEERLSRIEEKFLKKEDLKTTNEVAPIIAKAGQLILKNLPLILSTLPEIIKALESDQMNDNTDKVEILKQFGEIGQKVGEMFKNANW